MIGGSDIIYPRRLNSEMLDFVLRLFRWCWPEAVVEDHDNDADPTTIEIAIRNRGILGGSDGFFVYTNAAAQESWIRLGADPSNDDMMIYVLFGKNSTTFVVSDSLPKTPEMVAEIIQALDVNFPRRDR